MMTQSTVESLPCMESWLGYTDPSGCPRPEHPNPFFMRKDWKNLNGEWEFAFDQGRSGEARGMMKPEAEYPLKITVPFCPQSKLSGIGFTDFIYGCWYRRQISMTEEQLSRRVMLRFGAVDHYCVVYVNGQRMGDHTGGYTPFGMDITDALQAGDNTLCVYAQDDERDPRIPSGKQSGWPIPSGCLYTRTTGIWQTVWLEFLPETYIKSFKMTPLVSECAVLMELDLHGDAELWMGAHCHGQPAGVKAVSCRSGHNRVVFPLDVLFLWEPETPDMYTFSIGYGQDTVYTFFGMRDIRLEDGRFLLNNHPVFQRLVLDQGFYPDGIYTAPSWEDLEQDILLGKAMGFNGARLHQKVFEPTYLFLCDFYGYMVWGEYPSWGLDVSTADALPAMLPEWREVIDRDYHHPSIIGWCPLNETGDGANVDLRDRNDKGKPQNDAVVREIYEATKMLDSTRPCIDTSGWFHVKTDIYDVHDYRGDPLEFKVDYDRLLTDNELVETGDPPRSRRQKWDGKAPVFVSEFGGIGFALGEKAWGYGDVPTTKRAFIYRFSGLVDALLDNPKIMGFCYTQLTDVEGEQNGLYTYDRKPKFNPETIHTIISRKAAIEESGKDE